MGAPETRIQNQILRWLADRPYLGRFCRMNSGALRDRKGRLVRYGLPGLSDIVGILRDGGRVLCVEVKTKTGRQSETQAQFQKMIDSCNGIYILARDVNDLAATLEPYTRGHGGG